MGRLSDDNVKLAAEIIGRYPVARSALIPLLHVAQAQDGHVSDEAMEHVAELVGTTASEVLSTCSFYEMFKRSPGGTYRVNICRGISCHLLGADDLIEHASETLGVPVGGTTADGAITLEAVECVAACTEAPCLQVNYRYVGNVSTGDFDRLAGELRNGGRPGVPPHGTVATVRQRIPPECAAGVSLPDADGPPPWWARHQSPGNGNGNGAAAALPAPAPAPDGGMIVTVRRDLDDAHTLEGYLRTGGYEGLRRALERRAGGGARRGPRRPALLGRGGAGFPAGVKWGFCPPDAWPRYLVVNGDESEPGTYKDRLLMERDPHQLIEGCLIACYALGLSQCFLYVRGEMALAAERIAAALNEAYAAGYVGSEICGGDFGVDIVLHSGAGAYIVGEETALIESLEGNRGMPRLKPPFFPAAIGLYGRPTIVNNVETLANLPWIVTHGAAAFVARGAEQSAGTRVFAVSGHVRNPGVFEVPFGVTTFREIICDERYGGGIRDGRGTQGVHPRRGLGALVRPRAPGPPAGEGHRRRRRVDAGLRGHRGHGLHHRRPPRLPQPGALLRPRVLRQVHPLPRGHQLARGGPGAHPGGPGPSGGPGPAHRRLRQHQPRPGLAAAHDHHLPAGPLGGVAHRLGAARLPRRVRGLPAAPHPRGRGSARRHERDPGAHHRGRRRGHGRARPAADRRLRAGRHVHPPVLLPPADAAGGHVPHVPRGRGHRPGPGAGALVHAGGARRDGGGDRQRRRPQGPGRCAGVPAGQPPPGLPRVRQGRGVPPAGPDHGLRAGREPLRGGEAPLRQAAGDQRAGLPRPGALHPLRPLHPLRRRGWRASRSSASRAAATTPR